MNQFGHHHLSLSEFSAVILRFGGDIGDESHYKEVFLVRRQRFLLLRLFDNCSNRRSRQGLVRMDLLDNFQNILKLLMVMESDFMKSL